MIQIALTLEKISPTKSLNGFHKRSVQSSTFPKLFLLTSPGIINSINYARHHCGFQQYQTAEGELLLSLSELC